MGQAKFILAYILCISWIVYSTSCSGAKIKQGSIPPIVLTGSTPGDPAIKSLLTIDPAKMVDFIRWDLTLSDPGNTEKSFALNLIYGLSQPNTLGFIGGGEKLSFIGKYTSSASSAGNFNAVVYRLISDKLPGPISLVKLNENVFHLLTTENKLMSGNGGWSYTLNRKVLLSANISETLVSGGVASSLHTGTSRQITFEGRTPCTEINKIYEFGAGKDCFKLKWLLVLTRDSNSPTTGTYTLNRTLHRASLIDGNWAITKGRGTNSKALILQLDPDKPNESLSFLLGDENVIFFLNKKNEILTGNGDFSYTLNRRRP